MQIINIFAAAEWILTHTLCFPQQQTNKQWTETTKVQQEIMKQHLTSTVEQRLKLVHSWKDIII